MCAASAAHFFYYGSVFLLGSLTWFDMSFDIGDIISFFLCLISFTAIIVTCHYERKHKKQEKIRDTLLAFNTLQKDVFDPLIMCSSKDVSDAIEGYRIDDEAYTEIYKMYKTQVARCEHFAIGISNNVYDFDTFYKLGGIHLKYLYQKLEPIILESRLNSHDDSIPFTEFEKLYHRICDTNK